MNGFTHYIYCRFYSLLLFILYLVFPELTFPQHVNEYSFVKFDSENELSQNFINDLHQDKTGFLWIATKNGLNRYDGYNVEIFRHSRRDSNSIIGNYVNCIFEDSKGILWFGTGNGLSQYDPVLAKFTNFTNISNDSLSLSNNTVNSVCEDVNHKIWIGTADGLNLLNPLSKIFSRYYHSKKNTRSLLHNNVMLVYPDKEEGIWLGYNTDGLSYFSPTGNKFVHFSSANYPDFIPNQVVKSIYDDGKGNVFITGSWNVFLKIEKSNMKLYNLRSSGLVHSINNFFSQSSDSTLFIINDTDISIIDLDKTHNTDLIDHRFNYPHSFFINSFTKTRDGVLWLGTSGFGLYKLVPQRKNFKSILYDPGKEKRLKIRSVRAIYEDTDGDLWIGGYSSLNVIRKFQSNYSGISPENMTVENIEVLDHKNIYSINIDPLNKNILWIGTEFNGLFKYNKIKNNSVRIDLMPEYKGLIRGDKFTDILDDSHNNVWVATNSEILKFTNNKIKPERFEFTDNNLGEISSTEYTCLFEDYEGKIWIGTINNGIIVLNPSTKNYFKLQNNPVDEISLTSNSILFINEDEHRNIWIGTSAGLNKYNPDRKTLTCYTRENGLKDDCIYAVYQDKSGMYWMSSNYGISKFDPSQNTFENFEASYGLQNNEFNFAAHFKNKNGMIFFGGIKGITYFKPESIGHNSYIPDFTIVKFLKFNKETSLDKSIMFTDHLDLSYKDNVFSFELTSFNFSYPQLNMFAYKLEGLDTNWNYIDAKRRFVSLTGLNPGNYLFKYKSANNDGIWNENYHTLSISISPPYWQTWWFRTASYFIIGVIILLAYRKRVRNLENERNRQIEFSKVLIDKQEEERERIAGELHDDIGQAVIIANNKLKMGLCSPGLEKSMEYFNCASVSLDKLSDQISNISHNLHPQELAQLGLTLAVESMMERISDSTRINFSMNIENIDNKLNKEHEINLFRIIQEAVNNIIKHSQAVNASVDIINQTDKIICEIIDDGKGYNHGSVDSEQPERPHFGITSMHERAQLINGEVMIDSKINHGTSVKIVIKLNN